MKNIGPYDVSFYYGAHGPCVWSQTTILALHRESLVRKWDMVLILNYRTLNMVLGVYYVVQFQNVGYFTITFFYGACETSLYPLDTTMILQREICHVIRI